MSNKRVQNIVEVDVNAHLHTPYSFSAFDTVAQATQMAADEEVRVIGINDFNTMDGYGKWNEECRKRKIYPLFNIEFISLHTEDQANGVRVNDPDNPGRTYISGKGLAYPVQIEGECAEQLANVREDANHQVERMCEKLNEVLSDAESPFTLDFDGIQKELSRGVVRERHLAKALRIKAYAEFADDEKELQRFFERLFAGKKMNSVLDNHAAVEGEIRSNLLKAGGAAFIPEAPDAFLPLEEVRQIILAARGIPTYPFLADNAKGEFTDFERDLEKVAKTLKKRGIYSVEFITTRNSVETLEKYAGYLYDNGFIVTFGSEHNSAMMEPIKLTARGGKPLTEMFKRIGYYGACVVAAHQDIVQSGLPGYVGKDGEVDVSKREDFIKHGDAIIKSVIG